MFFAYCYPKSGGWHTPATRLDLDDLLPFCNLQHKLFEEVIITDESDFCALHLKNHVLKVPISQDQITKAHIPFIVVDDENPRLFFFYFDFQENVLIPADIPDRSRFF